jgi:hypothetical protein
VAPRYSQDHATELPQHLLPHFCGDPCALGTNAIKKLVEACNAMGRKLDGKIGRIKEPPEDDFLGEPGAVTFLELLD